MICYWTWKKRGGVATEWARDSSVTRHCELLGNYEATVNLHEADSPSGDPVRQRQEETKETLSVKLISLERFLIFFFKHFTT